MIAIINGLCAEKLFRKRFKEAVLMKAKHHDLFAKFNATFKPETAARWDIMVKDWELDNTKPNPYTEPINSSLCASPVYGVVS